MHSTKRFFLCLSLIFLLPLSLQATSQTIIGIITELVDDGKGKRMVVRILWDSNGLQHESSKTIPMHKKWAGCTIKLDGEAADLDAIKAGQLLFTHFNRQNMRLIELVTLPEGRLQQLRAPGDGVRLLNFGNIVKYGDEKKPKWSALRVYVRTDGGQVKGLVGQATRYGKRGILINSQSLTLKDGHLTGQLAVTIPGKPGQKLPMPDVAFNAEVNIPLNGDAGTFTGQAGERAVTGKVSANSYAPLALPATACTWIVVDERTTLAVRWQDGQAQQEHAYALFSKGYITGGLTEVSGTMADGVFELQASLEGKTGEKKTYVLKGSLVGDRLGGTVTVGEQSSGFFGGLLPVDCTWRGYIGHDDKKDIPPRE